MLYDARTKILSFIRKFPNAQYNHKIWNLLSSTSFYLKYYFRCDVSLYRAYLSSLASQLSRNVALDAGFLYDKTAVLWGAINTNILYLTTDMSKYFVTTQKIMKAYNLQQHMCICNK
jgi:hypothetical protein